MSSQTPTQDVLNHHLNCFAQNDLDGIMQDYTPESKLSTPEGTLKGIDAIRGFYVQVFPLFPTGKTSIDLKHMFVNDERAYIAWSTDSPIASIPIGTDSFIVRDGKIYWQTLAAH